MIDIIEQRRSSLAELCRKHRVKTLELFGSGANESFDPARSDLDFLVEYENLAEGQYAPAYFGLLHGLEDLFACKIDLVVAKAIRNERFRKGIERSRSRVYAA